MARPSPRPDPHSAGQAYKVVETSTVTDDELEKILNRQAAEGWRFDGFHFVVRDSSRRPTMAFVLFTRPDAPAGSPDDTIHPPKGTP
jgi:hypothetical protein